MTEPLTPEAVVASLPIRVVVDQHGHYWRDYGDHWSMCPVSDENVATDAVAGFYPLAAPAPDAPMPCVEDGSHADTYEHEIEYRTSSGRHAPRPTTKDDIERALGRRIWPRDDAAPPAAPDGLDVERLAMAVHEGCSRDGRGRTYAHDEPDEWDRELAEAYAERYARLASEARHD